MANNINSPKPICSPKRVLSATKDGATQLTVIIKSKELQDCSSSFKTLIEKKELHPESNETAVLNRLQELKSSSTNGSSEDSSDPEVTRF